MKHILLLRAINLGKFNKVPMLELKDLLISMDYKNVKTLLQSGNIFIETDTFDKAFCELKLKEKFGFEIPIIMTDNESLIRLSKHKQFKENSMIIFTNVKIDNEMIELLKQEVQEEFVIIDQCILINYHKSYHVSKYTNNWFERKLKQPTTMRNRNTVLKMIESFQ